MICDTIKPPLKKLRYNELVYAVTNKRGPFNSDFITDSNWFVPERQSQEWCMLQSGLFLDVNSTDYYILLLISILQTHPDIVNNYNNTKLTFDLERIRDVRSEFSGGGFTTVGKFLGGFTEYNDIFPIPTVYDIRYKSDKRLAIITDVGRNYNSDYTTSMRGNNSVLMIDWHEKLPMKGPMIFDGTWGETSHINVEYVPFNIDYDKWVEYIDTKLETSKILNKVNLNSAYLMSESSTEKLAILTIALALSNTSLKNHK